MREYRLKKYHLPALSQLHTFEAVARWMSFTVAADELCLTQSAVSRQIKALERSVGHPLFHRKHRAIELTAEGHRLFDAVTRGLDEIAQCMSDLRATVDTPQITVAASVAFSYYWLMPRLERFSERFPAIDLRILATDQKVDLTKGEADVAVLFGEGGWNTLETRLLFGERVYPVCSPGYLQAHPDLRRPEDFLARTLLHLEGGGNIWGGVDWGIWLATQGVKGKPLRKGIRLNSYPMVLQGAQSGRGVALGWSYVTDPMLADGRLICPVDKVLETRNFYHIGATDDRMQDPCVRHFFEWIMEEVAADADRA